MRTSQEEEVRDNVLQWTGRLSPGDAICKVLCNRANETLLLLAARYRTARNYGVSTCVIAADSLSFDRCHVAFAMIRLFLHRKRQREREREREKKREMLKLLLSTRHTLGKEYILQRINSRNRLAMTRFFHEVADRPEARHRSIFCSANDDRGFINVTKKRRDIKRAIIRINYTDTRSCYFVSQRNRERHSRRSSVAVT